MHLLDIASKFNRNRIENLLQKSLPYFLFLVFITTTAGAASGYLDHNAWKMGDWLINYQGGIIRRGLLGEVIYQLSYFSNINPGFYVIVLQVFFYGIFFYFSYLLLKKQLILLPYALLIFSPFIFTFQINDLQGGFRKEIIYFAVLAFIVWSASVKDRKTFEKIFYIILLLYPVIILSHEMFAIFLPYLLVVYFSISILTKKSFFLISILLLPSILSFLMATHYSGTSNQVVEIFNSIAGEDYSIAGGAISWLDKDTSFGVQQVVDKIKNDHYFGYIFIALFTIFAYIPIYEKLKLIAKNKFSLLLILVSMIGSIGLFIVAIDWGRFIYIHLVSIFLLSLISTQKINNYKEDACKHSVNPLIVIFFIIYTLLWHIPHCGSPSSAYKQINIIEFTRPYKEISFFIYTNSKQILQ